MAELDVAPDAIHAVRAGIDFVRFVEHGKQALRAGDAALQRGVDVRNAADRLQHEHHGAEERDELAGREIARQRLARREVDHERNAEAEHDLGHGHAERPDANHLEVLATVLLVDGIEPFALVVVAAEGLDDPVAANDLFGDLRHLADRILDAVAVAAERNAEDADDRGHDRKQDHDEYRQLRALQGHDAERRDDGQHVADRDRDDARHGLGNHLDVVGHPREQRPGRLPVEEPGRQGEELAEHLAAQRTDDVAADPAERRLGREARQPAADEDRDERDGQPLRRLKIAGDERLVHERLEQVDETRLDQRRRRHADDGDCADELVRRDVLPEAPVDRRRIRLAGVGQAGVRVHRDLRAPGPQRGRRPSRY